MIKYCINMAFCSSFGVRRAIFFVFAVAVMLMPLCASAQTPRTNIDRQPDWGPAGYDLAEFYYIPALDVYYEVGAARFFINEGDLSCDTERWVAVEVLPERFGEYDLYACYKVVMNGAEPWRNHRNHTFVYDGYRSKRFRQQTIRASRNPESGDKGRHNPKREQRQKRRHTKDGGVASRRG